MTWCQQTSNVPGIFLLILFSLTVKPASLSPVAADINTVHDNSAALSSAQKQAKYIQQAEKQVVLNDAAEGDDELFKDVDPRTLAAVLLEALNNSQKQKMTEKEDKGAEEEKERDLQGADRDRDGHQELELVMAAAAARGKEEKEREEEEEKKRAEEEERLTEKVKSHTTSQTIPLKEPVAPQDEVTKEEVMKDEERQDPEKEGLGEEEEQLSPEEVKNLETMLEEFQSYSTATKRERDTVHRESRGEYFDYLDRNGLMNNEIKSKGNDLALSKKKLKWQLEQEKNKIQPPQKGGNFMDDFNNNFADPEVEDEQDQEDEEVLSPEEEETQAKAEQEEVRRQAAEAQRAKAEEEKLADIASDMLLKYIVKQDKKKLQDGAEDKRSDEEDTSDDDDIDPQTIDKLIEISSKLHLPADDVVDIISDVEKKKKKDAPENLPWQRPLVPPSAPVATSTLLRKPPPSKPPQPNTSPLKTWFKDRASVKPSKQEIWTRQQWPFRAYPSYNFYQNPYRGYYPIYIQPPKSKSHYKPAFSLNDVLGNSLDYDFDYSSRRKSRPWAQSRPRPPPAFQRNLYFPNYIAPRTFKAVPMPKPRSPPRRWPSFYYQARAPVVTREDDYYSPLRQPPHESEEDLENFLERVFVKHPRMFQ
ncbi:caldesmon [Triplophysa rosa]|uniref:Neurosecretory protein VGF n=1 Tax=Triplophysa rosa TaxID=992332 RepID=A0A9W7X4K5_TRIRA|nr:caldesmon [Triplophysa rosa]KAI7814500.1 putative neurosecretory protein VGF [Triplophysa rosa]